MHGRNGGENSQYDHHDQDFKQRESAVKATLASETLWGEAEGESSHVRGSIGLKEEGVESIWVLGVYFVWFGEDKTLGRSAVNEVDA